MRGLGQGFFLAIFVQLVLSCQPPDCDRPDCGTCGNACCLLEFTIEGKGTEEVYNEYKAFFQNRGDDTRYTYIGGSDLRPYNTSADFILQGRHMTLVHRYNDTLDFSFSPHLEREIMQTHIRAFSISNIAGAYCDAGQNYKNLVGFIKAIGYQYMEDNVIGCPKKK